MIATAAPANPTVRVGDAVLVREQGVRPWAGKVMAVKWSHVSGWWCDIRREDDGLMWVIHESKVKAA